LDVEVVDPSFGSGRLFSAIFPVFPSLSGNFAKQQPGTGFGKARRPPVL
jgi:hypothetical protein